MDKSQEIQLWKTLSWLLRVRLVYNSRQPIQLIYSLNSQIRHPYVNGGSGGKIYLQIFFDQSWQILIHSHKIHISPYIHLSVSLFFLVSLTSFSHSHELLSLWLQRHTRLNNFTNIFHNTKLHFVEKCLTPLKTGKPHIYLKCKTILYLDMLLVPCEILTWQKWTHSLLPFKLVIWGALPNTVNGKTISPGLQT